MSPPSDSPPMSPSAPALRRAPVGGSVNEVLASLRHLQLSKAKSSPNSWGYPVGCGFGSPRSPASTPTTSTVGGGSAWLDRWDAEDHQPVERVESGRALRAKMFERLSKESGLEKQENSSPDVAWVSDLLQ
ncbi:hypothetical protein J5N97_025798 [Dioscorea zingiberensis]|nr:hypothetical protein J5N97_025798 [Dioscorea zingiberensis]